MEDETARKSGRVGGQDKQKSRRGVRLEEAESRSIDGQEQYTNRRGVRV